MAFIWITHGVSIVCVVVVVREGCGVCVCVWGGGGGGVLVCGGGGGGVSNDG